jgi:hypothetical protein
MNSVVNLKLLCGYGYSQFANRNITKNLHLHTLALLNAAFTKREIPVPETVSTFTLEFVC